MKIPNHPVFPYVADPDEAMDKERDEAVSHKTENPRCDHKHYDMMKHGRYCTCGTCMWDAGD